MINHYSTAALLGLAAALQPIDGATYPAIPMRDEPRPRRARCAAVQKRRDKNKAARRARAKGRR